MFERWLPGADAWSITRSVWMNIAVEPLRMRYWLASFYPLWVDCEIIGVGNVVLDITERVEAEEFRGVVMENLVEGCWPSTPTDASRT